eukprot:CAMPEP_0202352248 /NCGR_PEP_ID=MMETSP1126-20121109/8521_1 /ASSEMBLY_ACC=CAM_ASM_000457 /TAXON_ID=3047 /ORGANISM="Dunaliella tertiolecta, Strain CCMP1320" /LENGTH=149 /DNA_ID=CAMNT_0048944431 /DNA_START=1820 /DNA_END=2270 /DNA_ORIENTATION=+
MTTTSSAVSLRPSVARTSEPYVSALCRCANLLSTYIVKDSAPAMTTQSKMPPSKPACWKAKGRESTPAPIAELQSIKTLCNEESVGESCVPIASSGCGVRSKEDWASSLIPPGLPKRVPSSSASVYVDAGDAHAPLSCSPLHWEASAAD